MKIKLITTFIILLSFCFSCYQEKQKVEDIYIEFNEEKKHIKNDIGFYINELEFNYLTINAEPINSNYINNKKIVDSKHVLDKLKQCNFCESNELFNNIYIFKKNKDEIKLYKVKVSEASMIRLMK